MNGTKRAGSKVAPMPLPESATTRTRWAGEGISPRTSGTRWRIHAAARPEPNVPRAMRVSMPVW